MLFTLYSTTHDIIKAIPTSPATDRELFFGSSRNKQSYTTSILNFIGDLSIDDAREAILSMNLSRGV
jgi:hypothetical protein